MNRSEDSSFGGDAEATARKASTGTTPSEPISLMDSDDDEGGNAGGFPPETTRSPPKKTSLELLEDNNGRGPQKKAKIETAAPASATNNAIDGCMMNPQNPIKIFATDRDKIIRRRLRRKSASRTGISTSDSKDEEEGNRRHWSNFHCWTFREMLGFDRFSGVRKEPRPNYKNQPKPNALGIDWIFITTYIMDVDFLLNELPELIHVPIVVIVYQYKDFSLSGREENWIEQASSKGHSLTFLVRDPRAPPGTETNPLDRSMDFGCQHTKMTLVGYSSGRLRVQIHTSNLRRGDVHDKCQGAFLQDFSPKTEAQLGNFETSGFEESLATYLESYAFVKPLCWKDEKETLVSHLQTYDFSRAVGILVPSVPGHHKTIRLQNRDQEDKLYGYLKVQQAIRDHCCGNKSSNSSIVCQFSSMGSLSKTYLNKIADAWNAEKPGVAAVPKKKARLVDQQSLSMLRIVWPTIDEILTSVEGRQGGDSVPGRTQNLHRDFLRPLLHKWGSESQINNGDDGVHEDDLYLDKGRHVPHIKSYYQMCNDEDRENMQWFVLTSHNFSKAAWGEIQNRQEHSSEVLVIRHWELGVFVSPSTLGVDAMGPQEAHSRPNCDQSSRTVIPLPYKFKPNKYKDNDRPWVVFSKFLSDKQIYT